MFVLSHLAGLNTTSFYRQKQSSPEIAPATMVWYVMFGRSGVLKAWLCAWQDASQLQGGAWDRSALREASLQRRGPPRRHIVSPSAQPYIGRSAM